jgi:hypothetical protein
VIGEVLLDAAGGTYSLAVITVIANGRLLMGGDETLSQAFTFEAGARWP